ncbi:MAG: hypothetical protein K5694_06245 [Bacilli bacterium]|nr:hypothetical protein [Bacilli bacterium]
MTNYKKWYGDIKAHLADYKINILEIPSNGIYEKNGKEYKHILPKVEGERNYINDIARNSLKPEDRHHDWFHLNSSQTLCVNYFAMLMDEEAKNLSLILSRWINKEIHVNPSTMKFEKVDKSLYGDSNFDFYCEDTEGHKYFFEIKYTERGIAKKCQPKHDKSDKNLLKIYDEKYRKMVEKEGSILDFDNPFIFMKKHYQAFRNICCANSKEGDYTFFLTMYGNVLTRKELDSCLEYVSNKEFLKILYWEDIIKDTGEFFKNNEALREYFEELARKYLLE